MDTIKFMESIYSLKELKRTGWVKKGILECESVADHSFATSVLSLIYGCQKEGLSLEKVLIMSLIHDLAEAEVGDLTPSDVKKIGKKQKINAEKQTIHKICNNLDDKAAKKIISVFDEYIEGKSKEAILVKQIDKLEMALQANRYIKHHKKDLKEFINDAKKSIQDKEILNDFNKIL